MCVYAWACVFMVQVGVPSTDPAVSIGCSNSYLNTRKEKNLTCNLYGMIFP